MHVGRGTNIEAGASFNAFAAAQNTVYSNNNQYFPLILVNKSPFLHFSYVNVHLDVLFKKTSRSVLSGSKNLGEAESFYT